jgi:hypothetical protein
MHVKEFKYAFDHLNECQYLLEFADLSGLEDRELKWIKDLLDLCKEVGNGAELYRQALKQKKGERK